MSGQVPIAVATPVDTQLVEVVAPATLQPGYTFQASVDGKTVTITVPPEGVKEGQRFTARVTLPPAGETTSLTGAANNIPRGRWRDGLCDCLSLGLCHPSLWNAWCCPLILMGQVLTRMNMSWLGERDSPDSYKTFTRMVWLMAFYIAVNILFAPPSPVYSITGDPGDDDLNLHVEIFQPPVNPLTYLVYQLTNAFYGVYSLVLLVRLRRTVRERYALPNLTTCGDTTEDICCSLFCACCTNAQLARHTADYREKDAVCCSPTGLVSSALPPSTVLIV